MRRGVGTAACLIAMFSFASCARKDEAQPASQAAAVKEADAAEASLFRVPANQLASLKVVAVRRSVWSAAIHTSGTVDWDANHTTTAITQVTGPVSRLLVDLGDRVTVNQPLLYVSSPDLANAVSTYRRARNHQDYAKKTLDRSNDLLAHKVIAAKDVESAEQDYNDASAEVLNDLQALRIFGVTQQEIEDAQSQSKPINSELAVRSPITGTIVQKLVNPGLVIQAGMTACFGISDISTVWVQGHIYDRDLEAVRPGDKAEVTNASFPSDTFRGTVSYIGASINPDTRTTDVRIVTGNPRALLKKDMFVDALIHAGVRRNILTAPTSALLRTDDNQPFVYVEDGQGQFAQRLVTIGAQQGDDTEIVSGVKEGERIVAEGSIFLQFANSSR
jgi:membrane fusion protein, heavy metal efflux system